MQGGEVDIMSSPWACQGYEFADEELGEFALCTQATGFEPYYIWHLDKISTANNKNVESLYCV